MQHIKSDAKLFASFPLAIVVSCFNQEITSALLEGALERLHAVGIKEEDIMVVEVPGAIEIPVVAKCLARRQQVKVVIALGAVIRGETSHYDYVCAQVSAGCQQVMLDYTIPIIFGVLTVDSAKQAWARLGGEHGHKGREAADAAVQMYNILQLIETS